MSRKKIIFLSSVTLFVAIIAFLVYFLLIRRAETMLQSLVNTESNGKLYFKVTKVDLDIFHLRFDFSQPELRTIDSSNTQSGYHIKSDRISFSVHSLFSVLSAKQVIIDSVIIESPLIEVIKYKAGPQRKISLPDEMSKVYESLEKVLKVLNLNYLHVSDAKFRIYDRTQADTRPLQISNLNLTIDKVSKDQEGAAHKFLFADRILLEIYNQDILLPDGYHGIRFKRFWMGTRSQTIKLDSCYVYGKSLDTNAGEFSIFIDSLRIKKLDFNALAKNNLIKFDSALCINPDIRFKLHLKDKGKKLNLTSNRILNKDSIDQKLKMMLGNLDIGYMAVVNANVNIATTKHHKTNVYNTKGSNFGIGGLLVSSDPKIPINIGFIDLKVHDYTGYSPDSMYVITFDDVFVKEHKILLSNFRINPSKKNHDQLRKEIKMQAFELDEIDWITLLYENRIVAGHGSLIKPEVSMVLPKAKNKKSGNDKNPFLILNQLKHKIQLGELFIEDGNMKFQIISGPIVSLEHCYAGINVNKLLETNNVSQVIDVLDTFSFSKGDFHSPDMHLTLTEGGFSQQNKSLLVGKIVQSKNDHSQEITLNKLSISGITVNSKSDIAVAEIAWNKAIVGLRLEAKKNKKAAVPTTDFKVVINKITGGPTDLKIKTANLEASTLLNKISTGEIVLESGKKPGIKDLFIDGQSVNLDQESKVHGSLSTFRIADNKPSSFENVLVKLPFKGEMASVLIPRLTFSSDLYKSMNGKISADYIELSRPSISFSRKDGVPADTSVKKKNLLHLPLLHINRLSIDQPVVENLPASLAGKMQLSPGNLRLDLLGINSDSSALRVDSIRFAASQPAFRSDKMQLTPSGPGKISFSVSAVRFQPATYTSKIKWSFNLNSLKLAGLQLNTLQHDSIKQTISISSLNLENLKINDSSFSTPEAFINQNNRFRLSNATIGLRNPKTNLELYNLTLSKSGNSLSIDSVSFSPVMDRESYMKTQAYQKVYIQLHTGRISVKDIDFAQLLKDTVISLKRATLNDLHMMSYKDKRLPFQHGVVKPMLTDLLLNIKPKILVDSLILKNGLIEYEEFNDRTQLYGKIKLSKIRGAVSGVRTFDPSPDDSLRFNIYARLIDTADLRLKYQQSYADSLSGFHLKLIVSPFNLTALNPVLRPFASAELKSGNLDTIRMSVTGRKYVAYGTMKMYYTDLNAQILAKGDSSNRNIVTRSVSFFANRIVRTNSRRGTGDVFAERDPEKGFVNYWVKIVIGGVLTNSGVRTDKKQQKKYRKALNNHAVPPIPDIPVDY